MEVRDARPPAIVTQPPADCPARHQRHLLRGDNGGAPMSYQWRKDGTNLVDGGRIAGATSGCLTITNVVEEDSGD